MGESVSRQVDLPCSYDGWETARKGFPMVMIAKVPTADGKLFAKGFLWQLFAVFPRRAGNYSLRVSYGDDSQCPHAG